MESAAWEKNRRRARKKRSVKLTMFRWRVISYNQSKAESEKEWSSSRLHTYSENDESCQKYPSTGNPERVRRMQNYSFTYQKHQKSERKRGKNESPGTTKEAGVEMYIERILNHRVLNSYSRRSIFGWRKALVTAFSLESLSSTASISFRGKKGERTMLNTLAFSEVG